MAGFTNPDSVHRASAGAVAPASWGDTVNDDINFLAGAAAAEVAATEATTSGSYTDLSTIGPAVTVTTGANAIVIVTATMANSAGGLDGAIMSAAVSGATTLAASDANCALTTTTTVVTASCASVITGLTAGLNTFTAKYKVSGGGTGTFVRRWITVIPLP